MPIILVLVLCGSSFAAESNLLALTNGPAAAPEPPPSTSRDYFNSGTRKLRDGKLREAEALFQTALAQQDEKVQPPALFNLGHVRFNQGTEELKKSPAAGPTASGGRAAARQTGQAIDQADSALAGNDVQKMLDAYLRGRGTQRDTRLARRAINRALEAHGATLRKWQRSLGDFQSAAELRPSDTNAQHNAGVVQRAIAKLIDSLRELQQAAAAAAQRQEELAEKLRQLRGRIPDDMMPPGGSGDEEEEEEDGKDLRPEDLSGQQEGPSREGEELRMSPEQARWLLEGFSLDTNRRLPMGQGDAQPRERNRRNW